MNFDLKQFDGLKTPFYWYDSQLLDQTLKTVKSLADKYGYHIHYAVKANGNIEILRRMREAGLGTDCVSGNEPTIAAPEAINKPGEGFEIAVVKMIAPIAALEIGAVKAIPIKTATIIPIKNGITVVPSAINH